MPNRNWSKLPGYTIDRSSIHGAVAAESLNFAVLANNLHIKRSEVEAGLKDIINGLTKILRNGSGRSLALEDVGNLQFDAAKVKFSFAPGLINSLNEKRSLSIPQVLESRSSGPDKESDVELVSDMAPLSEIVAPEIPKIESIDRNIDPETKTLSLELDEASKKLASIEKLISETFKDSSTQGTHTHSHTGSRYWKDNACTICQVESIVNPIDLVKIKEAEKESDKMLLHVSLSIDKEYLDKKKVILF